MMRAGRASSALRGVACALITAAAVCWPAAARADSGKTEGIAGWEGDSHSQGFGFAAVGWLIPAGPKLVAPLRVTGSYLYYDFESAGTITRVHSPGLALIAGVRLPGQDGSLTFLGGGEVRRERRTTDGGPVDEQTTSGIVLQADGDGAFSRRWRGYLLANYGGASRYLYARSALRGQVTNLDWKGPTAFFLGFEAIGQGNDESRGVQGGGFAEWNFVPQRASLALRGGYKESWSPGEAHRRGGYFGLTLYRRF
jgi:Cellulose biosynthesis protein BcsS